MNRKTLVIFFIGLILSFLIYKLLYKDNINYMALGDELALGITPFQNYNKSYGDFFSNYLLNKNKLNKYISEFSLYDYRIQDLINDMNNAKEITIDGKKVNINQAIAASDIITLSFGQKEIYDLLISNYNGKFIKMNNVYDEIDNYFNDYIIMLNKIRKINSGKIFIIGLYNPLINANQESIDKLNKLFYYIDKKFESIENNKNIFYVSISDSMDKKSYYIPSGINPYPSIEGYNYIFNELLKKYLAS